MLVEGGRKERSDEEAVGQRGKEGKEGGRSWAHRGWLARKGKEWCEVPAVHV